MPYLNDFRYDVFITYRRKDNPKEAPWVTHFHEHLLTLLRARGNHSPSWDFAVFRDTAEIERNEPLPDAIKHAVQNSATLLVVMSDAYARESSYWTEQERLLFAQATSARPEPNRRTFIARLADVPQHRWPDQFANLVPYELWERDADSQIVRPTRLTCEQRFSIELEKLADDLFKQLNRLLPPRTRWQYAAHPEANGFERQLDGSWVELPKGWRFEEECRNRDYVQLFSTDGRRHGIRLYDNHCDLWYADLGWRLFREGHWIE